MNRTPFYTTLGKEYFKGIEEVVLYVLKGYILSILLELLQNIPKLLVFGSIAKLPFVFELLWLEQHYNLILMGPSGVGKTFIAAGLCYDAIQNGYDALFRSMQQLLDTLKLKDVTRSAKAEYNRLLKAQLLVIDDMMMFPVEKNEANRLFHLINHLHEQSSVIVTTNKSPKQWAEVLNDEVLATAMLDRLLYRCEIIQLSGKSYRLANRQTIFENTNESES